MNNKKILLWAFPTLVLLALLILVIVPGNTPTAQPAVSTLAPKKMFTDRTQPGRQAFWDQHLDKTVNELFAGTYFIPEIRDRVSVIWKNLQKKYGNIDVDRSTTYIPASTDVMVGASFENGKPHLTMVIPKLMDVAEELYAISPQAFPEKFKVEIGVAILHEMEHLEEGDIGGGYNPKKADFLAAEQRTWANTCKYGIEPIVEKYPQLSVPPDNLVWYRGWVAAGKDANDPRWIDFVNRLYGPVSANMK